MSELRKAAHLLEDALAVLKDRWRTSHLPDCPRRRDDYECTCGLSDLCGRIEDWCKNVPTETACPDCGMWPAYDGMWHKPGCPAIETNAGANRVRVQEGGE